MPEMATVPERSCAACRRKFPRNRLLRVVAAKDGRMGVNPGAALQGRSAYLCYERRCLEVARKRRALQHTLRRPVTPEIWAEIERYMAEHGVNSSAEAL